MASASCPACRLDLAAICLQTAHDSQKVGLRPVHLMYALFSPYFLPASFISVQCQQQKTIQRD